MICPNCGSDIHEDDVYCHHCGQKNATMRKSVKEFIRDFFKVYFSFDTRFFRTIGPMLFKPGYLSQQFFEGKRKQYLDPLRFYVFVSFVVFFLAGFADFGEVPPIDIENQSINLENTEEDDALILSFDEEEQEVGRTELLSALNQIISKKDQINANILRYLSVALFLLMPLFALLNYFIFFKRKAFYLEHLILSFHIHSFFLLLSIIALLFYIINAINVFWIVLLCLTLFTFLSMKNYYKTTWLGSLWRFCTSIFIYTLILGFAVAGIAILAIYFSGAKDIFNLGS